MVNVTIPDAKLIQAIDASDVAVTYGDTDKKVSATTNGNGAISYAVKSGSGDYIDVDATTGALTVKKVPENGKAYVTVTAAETDSCWAATKDVTVTVSKAQLTIKANDQTYTYNGDLRGEADSFYDDPAEIAEKVTVSGSGLKNNDALTEVTLDGTRTKAGQTAIEITDFKINGNTAAKDNYDITLAPGKLTIVTERVMVTGLTATDRAYAPDNLEVALSGGTVSGLIDGDDVTVDLTGAKGTMADADAGEDKPVTVSGVRLAGADADNYYLSAWPTGVTVTITKADQDAPVPPTAETVTGNSVTLKKTAGYQYSMDGTSWQDSNVFNGLSQDTEYTFYQRLAGDENHEPSPSSEGTEIRTGSITYTAVKTEGDRQTVGQNADLVVEIKRSENDAITYDHFTGVKMDGRDVPEKDASGKANWTAAKGSLVLTVKSTYMETLAAGDHTLKVLFKDGSVEIPVTISAAETSPKTGDASNLLLWSVLALLSLAGIAVLTASKAPRKKRQ